MNSTDEETQVFIVRLWRERREIEGARPVLRGTVEHVASSERRSITNMDDVTAFVQPYIEAIDANTVE
jgi:hypothetical protein